MNYEFGMLGLYVRDMEMAKAFYVDFLGMKLIDQLSGPGFTFLMPAKGTAIALQEISSLPADLQNQPGGFEVNLEVDDIDAAASAWKEHGVEIISDVADMGAGRFFRARDTEGHFLSVYQLYDVVKNMRP
jgi:predicted enzyme related to lactoylglutathione lyase